MKKIVKNILIAFAIGFAVFTLLVLISDREDLQNAISKFPKIVFLYMVGILLLDYLVGGLRNYIVLRTFNKKISFLDALENNFFGIFFSFVTPMSIGGQPFQIYHLTQLGINSADVTNIVLSRTFGSLLVNFFIALCFLAEALRYLTNKSQILVISIGLLISIVLTVLALVAFLNAKFVAKFLSVLTKLTKSEKIRKIEENAFEWISKMSASTKKLWTEKLYVMILDMLLGALMFIFLIPIQLYLPLVYMTKRKNVASYFGFVSLFILVNTTAVYIPTPGSSGGIEGLYKIVLSNIYGSGTATSALLIWRLVTYYLPIVVGLLLIWRMNMWGAIEQQNTKR